MKKIYNALKEKYKIIKGKIRTRLVASFVLIIILAISSIGLISYYMTSKDTEYAVIQSSQGVTGQIVENLEFNFQHINTILLSPFYNPDFVKNIETYVKMDEIRKFVFRMNFSDWFINTLYLYTRKDLVGVYIFYDSGEIIYSSTGRGEDMGTDKIKQSEWFNRAVEEDGRIAYVATGKSLFSPDRKLFYASRVIKDISSDRYTIMMVEFNTKVFYDICSKAVSNYERKLFITDETGNIVFGTDKWQDNLGDLILYGDSIGKNTFWYVQENERFLATISESALSGWKVVSVVSEKNVYENTVRIRNITIIIALISIAFCTIIALGISTKISNPIIYLLKIFDSVKKGDYSIRALIKDEYDETNLLGKGFNSMIEEIDDLIKGRYINELKLRDAELGYLNSQINPHFLYNTLDCIKSMIEWNETQKIPEMINNISDMFRYSIRDRKGLVTVKDELYNTEKYLNIQSIRFNGKFSIIINIENAVLIARIPKFIIQPIVENAVFHGIENKKGRSVLTISSRHNNKNIWITVKDDGIGINKKKLEQLNNTLKENEKGVYANIYDKSIGLVNVHLRLHLIYGDDYGLSIFSEEGVGTEVIIKFSYMPKVKTKEGISYD